MRKLIAALVAAGALLLAVAPVAAGASTTAALPPVPAVASGLPLVLFIHASDRPPGYPTTAGQATAVAKTSRVLQQLHRSDHPLQIKTYVWDKPDQTFWFLELIYKNKIVAQANISPTGRLLSVWTGPLAVATYARGHYAKLFDSPWVVVTFCLLFLLPFVDRRRWRRMIHLDALVMVSLMVSYYLFDHAHLEAAVWTVYPPLLYLAGRLLVIGWQRRPSSAMFTPLLSMRVLSGGLILLTAARVALNFLAPYVIDVGYASASGAARIGHGLSPYLASGGGDHGDTYGPITYLAYLPFNAIFGFDGRWGYVISARMAALVFDLVTIGGLVALGRSLRSGREGQRLGLALGWAWAACPFTLLGLMMHSNDGLIAMLGVLSLLTFRSAAARGGLIGLAAAAKFSPAILLPLYAGRRRGDLKATSVCIVSFAVVVTASVAAFLPSGGLHQFWNETIGFQLHRVDVFSPWALHAGLNPLKIALEIAAVGVAAASFFLPGRRTPVQIAAVAGALTIAVQLPAVHWFYYYIVWFMPFALVAVLGGAAASTEDVSAQRPATTAAEPALALV